jgi:hypothetical protein
VIEPLKKVAAFVRKAHTTLLGSFSLREKVRMRERKNVLLEKLL